MDLNNPSPSLFMGSSDDDLSSFGWNGLGFSCSAEPTTTTTRTSASDRMLFSTIQDMRLHEDEYVSPGQGSSGHEVIKKDAKINGFELWKEGDRVATMVEPEKRIDLVKWNMSTKMRLMPKIKSPDHDGLALKLASNGSNEHEFEDHNKLDRSSYSESPVRVCSDCKTTKTPLWRSGPKGPKSLCNACGIRQRKARRAMAAALTSAGGAVVATGQPLASKIKVQHKEKEGQNGLKKRCRMIGAAAAITTAATTTTSGLQFNGKIQKPGLEDFLIKLSQKIAFNRVCPQDEKDAAILLMALSSGLVHG